MFCTTCTNEGRDRHIFMAIGAAKEDPVNTRIEKGSSSEYCHKNGGKESPDAQYNSLQDNKQRGYEHSRNILRSPGEPHASHHNIRPVLHIPGSILTPVQYIASFAEPPLCCDMRAFEEVLSNVFHDPPAAIERVDLISWLWYVKVHGFSFTFIVQLYAPLPAVVDSYTRQRLHQILHQQGQCLPG